MSAQERIPFIGLLLAAGSGSRMGSETPKQYLTLRGRTLVEWSAIRLSRVAGHVGTVLAVDAVSLATRLHPLREALAAASVRQIVEGGATRQDSCRLAFNAATLLDSVWEVVCVHDCARPFFSIADTERAIDLAREHGGAILGHRAHDTLKRVDAEGRIEATIERETVFQAATPQAFRRDCFERMLAHAARHDVTGTDDAGLAEACGVEVRAVESSSTNLKVTRASDLELARGLQDLLEHS